MEGTIESGASSRDVRPYQERLPEDGIEILRNGLQLALIQNEMRRENVPLGDMEAANAFVSQWIMSNSESFGNAFDSIVAKWKSDRKDDLSTLISLHDTEEVNLDKGLTKEFLADIYKMRQ